MKEKMIYPFSIIGEYLVVDPESQILIALSKYRHSEYSDKELARYISKGLAAILYFHNAHIEQYNMAEGIEFKGNNITPTQDTRLTKLLRLLRLHKQ